MPNRIGPLPLSSPATSSPGCWTSPPGTILNVMLRAVPSGQSVECRHAALAEFGVVQTTATEADENSDNSVRLAVSDPTDLPAPGSDAALLSEGYATLTALRSIAEDPSTPVEDMLHPE